LAASSWIAITTSEARLAGIPAAVACAAATARNADNELASNG
jgi:hypothetical protein